MRLAWHMRAEEIMMGDRTDGRTDGMRTAPSGMRGRDGATGHARRGLALLLALACATAMCLPLAGCGWTGSDDAPQATMPGQDGQQDGDATDAGVTDGRVADDAGPSDGAGGDGDGRMARVAREPEMTQVPAPAGAVPSEPVTVSVAAVGDVLMHERVIESGRRDDGSYDFMHLFAHVMPYMADADVRIVNQETPIAGAAYGYTGYPAFNGPFEVADSEVASGVNLVMKATNHTFDQGYEGLVAELGLWGQRHPGTPVIGVANPDGMGALPTGFSSPAGPYVYERDGFRIAFLNYTDVLNASIDPSRDPSVIGLATREGIARDVRWARTGMGADAVIAYMHWGEEYVEEPVPSEREWASLMASLGVDVIIGGHPHVIQPIEVLDGGNGHRTLVFWSVGNFTSTQTNNRNMIGLLARVSLTKDASGVRISSWEGAPVVTHRAHGTSFTTYLLRDYTDDLARENLVRTTDPDALTVGWCHAYCSRVLGETYDAGTGSIGWHE